MNSSAMYNYTAPKSVVRTLFKDVTFIVPLKFKSDCFLRRHVTFASAVYLYMFTKQITSLKLMTCLAKNTAIEILVFAKLMNFV